MAVGHPNGSNNWTNGLSTRRTKKLGNASRLKKQREWRKRLDPSRLLCSDSSSPLSRLLPVLIVLLFGSWSLLTILAFSKISETPIAEPLFDRATEFLANVRKGTMRGTGKFSSAFAKHSLAERVPLIDMRELAATLPFDNPDGGAWKQGWDVQPVSVSKNEPVKIFVVPHSHCDPGWIKTFDDYFQSQTKQILSTVIEALSKDPRRKFIWAEISYFEWWWREQPAETQRLTRKLLANRQLEFVTGGWVQPDEANTQLFAMEIQLQEGHDWIRKTFGEAFVPKYGWSIDPFGYSPTMAYLLKKYGFKAMLIQRVHYAVKKELAKRQHLEFNWRQTWDTTGEYDIFCHLMPFFSYDVPHTCGPDPSVCCQFDFARIKHFGGCPWHKPPQAITDGNIKERAMLLLDQYLKKSALYRSNVVIAPLGDDFRYQTLDEAESQYNNYQKIFDYINSNVEGAEIQFGTLSDYFEAVMGVFEAPILKGSFFTYSDVNEDYWSGYYTSRVFDKALDRKLERTLFAAAALGANKEELMEPRRALSLFQHHDGVTGTAKDHVVKDYAKRIHEAIKFTQNWIARKIVTVQPNRANTNQLLPCWRSSESRVLGRNECNLSKPVHAYNPLTTTQTCGDSEVGGKEIKLVWLPCDVAGPLINSKAAIQFDPITGLMTHPIREEWMVWHDKGGGAYLFVPDSLKPFETSGSIQIKKDGFVGLVSDARGKWKRRVIEKRVPLEFGATATVIDFIYETNLQSENQEWIVRFTGDIQNRGVFHTDLNGFNFDTHYFRRDMPLQSQVFPMPTLASIEDERTRMTILSDHAQGTASLKDSSIDLWLDRRISTDDNRGLGQGVTDNVPTRTRLRLVLEPEIYDKASEFRATPLTTRMWDELNHPLELFGFTDASGGEAKLENENKIDDSQQSVLNRMWDMLHHPVENHAVPGGVSSDVKTKAVAKDTWTGKAVALERVVPFVFMVYKRVDFFKKSVDSLLKSDFPKSKVPLIVSHDGHFADFVQYVESLKDLGFRVIQLFHPFACSEHPDTFPGEDPALNENYRGDMYGNPRSGWATCCKHHFTWLMKTVFELDLGDVKAESFLFMEEDYVVAPTVYSAIQAGLNLFDSAPQKPREGFFGLVLDTSDGFTKAYDDNAREFWFFRSFLTGPMVLPRAVFEKIRDNAKEYCTFDDYNWDWSLVHLQGIRAIPGIVLVPSRPQVLHIGFEGGMHEKDIRPGVRLAFESSHGVAPEFHGTEVSGGSNLRIKTHNKGFGGWGHPKDQQHCLDLLGR